MHTGYSKTTLLFAFLIAALGQLFGQSATSVDTAPDDNSNIYRGFRLSLYGFKIKNQSDDGVVLECSLVNTGRESVTFSKSKKPTPVLIVELDTFNIPTILQGKEQSIVEALYRKKIQLMPGQTWQKIELEVARRPNPTPAPVKPQPAPSGKPKDPPAPQSNKKEDFFDYTHGCPDLVFDTIYIKSVTSKEITLDFVIKNIGPKAAYLNGKSHKRDDNMAVNVYFNTSSRLTRGALLADGIFLDNAPDNPEGILMPGKRLAAEIKISLHQRNKHLSNLIFEADPFQSILECDKTNNTKSIKLPPME